MGCQVQSHDYSTYVGGEIINPKSNFVLLMQRGKLIDSLFLNEHNIFGKMPDNFGKGLNILDNFGKCRFGGNARFLKDHQNL